MAATNDASQPANRSGIDPKRLVVISYLAGGRVLMLFCYLNPEVRRLSIEVATELMKVTWPSWAETRVSTIAVVVASGVAAILLFVIDTIAYKVMVDWLPALWEKL